MEVPRNKEHKIVLIDSFSGIQSVDVTGRFNHVISSEIDIEREFNVLLKDSNADDTLESPGFQLASEPNYVMRANIAFPHETLQIKQNACMRQTEKLYFKPKASNNSLVQYPRDEMTLLPYLISDQCYNNNYYEQIQFGFQMDQFTDAIMEYDPRVLGDGVIYIGHLADAAAANNVILNHRVDWRTVQFAGQTVTDPLIPVDITSNGTDLYAICRPDTVTVLINGVNVTFTIEQNLWREDLGNNGVSYPIIRADNANGTNDEGSHGKRFLALRLHDETMFTPPVGFVWPQANGADTNPFIFIAKPHPILGHPICRDLTPDLLLAETAWLDKAPIYHLTPANRVASLIYPLNGPKQTGLRAYGDYTFEYTPSVVGNLEYAVLTGIRFTLVAARVTAITNLAAGSNVVVVLRIPTGYPSRKITTEAEYVNPTVLAAPLDILCVFKKNDIAVLDGTHIAIRLAANPNQAQVRGVCVVLHEGPVLFDQNTHFLRDVLAVIPPTQHPQNLTTGIKRIINSNFPTNFFQSLLPTINFVYKIQWVITVATGAFVVNRTLCTHPTQNVVFAFAGQQIYQAYVSESHAYVTPAMRVAYGLLDFILFKAAWHNQQKALNGGVNGAALQQTARDNHPLTREIPTDQPCFQVVPALYNNQGYDINEAVHDGFRVVLREKLLMFKTMNHVYPFDIYNRQFGEWWPIQLQDFNLRFEDDFKLQELVAPSQIMSDDQSLQSVTGSCVNTRLYIRSRDSGRQEEKPLDGINYSHPFIQRFQGIGEVECIASGVLPDLFFIYGERVYTPTKCVFHPPKVSSIQLKVKNQPYRMYEGGRISQYDIRSATRRNSHKMANADKLGARFGGALFKVSDFGSLLDSQLQTFSTNLSFTVDYENEPAQDNNKDAEYNNHISLPVRTTVLFVFRDGVVLNGKYDQMEFRQTNL